MFRKVLTVFIFVLFVLAGIPVFFATSLSYSIFSSSFYHDTLVDTAYPPLVDSVVSGVHGSNPDFQKLISREELTDLFEKYFNRELFRRLVDDASVRFLRDVEFRSPVFADRKAKIIVDYRPLVEPTQLFIRELNQKIGGKMGYFDQASEEKLLEKIFPSSKNDFTVSVPLGVSRQEVSFLIEQSQRLWFYCGAFLLAFGLLILLTWIPDLQEGVTYTGLMWLTGGTFALFLIFFFMRLDSFFASDIHAFVKNSLPDPASASDITLSLQHALRVLATAFAKIYALVCSAVILLGVGVYALGRRFPNTRS
jgi:hypothetical protein